jgi:hypothetical protein
MAGQTGNTNGNDWVQVSRLGNPLVNEVVVPASLKDAFNSISPDQDAGIPEVVARVTDPEVARLIQAIYGIEPPQTPRNDLTEIFLTGITTKAGGPIQADLNSQLNNADVNANRFRPSEMLRLNLSVPVTAAPNRLGVLANDLQGFPNGRRLTDDVVDIALQAVEGAALNGALVDALAAGDKVDALPNGAGVNTRGSGGAPAAAPSAGTGGQTTGSTVESSSTSPMAWTMGAVGTAGLAFGLGMWFWSRRRRTPLPAPVSPATVSVKHPSDRAS